MPVLEIDRLSVAYGGVGAVHEVSLTVPAGGIVTVIGPNGAGKTTLLHAVMGILRSQGRLALRGESLAGLAIEQRVAAGMCLVPEQRELFATLRVEDNLLLGAWRHRGAGRAARRAQLAEIYALFPRLAERSSQAAGTLSGGERQMLAMGRALMAKPDLLMLDEPSLGLAPLIVRDIFTIIGRLRDQGTAILLVEQNARAALAIADTGHVLEAGRITLSGASATLASDPRVVQTYLGLPTA
jgi:branched-chain amino acid transport system ATP-binding protein